MGVSLSRHPEPAASRTTWAGLGGRYAPHHNSSILFGRLGGEGNSIFED